MRTTKRLLQVEPGWASRRPGVVGFPIFEMDDQEIKEIDGTARARIGRLAAADNVRATRFAPTAADPRDENSR